MLQEAQELVRDIRGGTDIHTIQAFRSEFRKLKDAFERVGNLAQYLLEPQVLVLQKAAATLKDSWPFLRAEPGLSADLTQAGLALEDKLGRESFFREIPEIERLGRKLQSAFEALLQEALAARTKAYDVALQQLGAIPGWTDLDEDQRRQIEEPLYRLAVPGSSSISIPQVRAEGEACETRLWDAQAKALQLLEGERVVSLRVGQFFQGGIETEEQLEAVLDSVRQACARLLAAGKKVVLQ
jgi:hypothetical protein